MFYLYHELTRLCCGTLSVWFSRQVIVLEKVEAWHCVLDKENSSSTYEFFQKAVPWIRVYILPPA